MKLDILGAEGIIRIDRAARHILENTGVEVPHQKMLTLFEHAGAGVTGDSMRVRISFEKNQLSNRT